MGRSRCLLSTNLISYRTSYISNKESASSTAPDGLWGAESRAAPPAAGFHTFDYARHFLSCCSRMLGVEHVTRRGSIMLEYYGRNVGVKIMPVGVQPSRFLAALQWEDTVWRRGELEARRSEP